MKTDKNSILQYLTANKDLFFERFNLSTLGLIGSFAKDEATSNSDIDIIVDFKPETDDVFSKKENMRLILGAEFERKIDICTQKYLKSYFKDQILKSAIYV